MTDINVESITFGVDYMNSSIFNILNLNDLSRKYGLESLRKPPYGGHFTADPGPTCRQLALVSQPTNLNDHFKTFLH